ncbi:hypothetical protein [Halothiobacillus diazotrophicus]|uniref:hypothetical protein n=1 Tax=Halothiobacillus diazotrophicus TaxID=1860122 RepID=UPI0009EF49EA|nr:hypothetical protein [Halothiobacillus diazotrophicus]
MKTLSINRVPPIILTEPEIIGVSGYRRALGGESPTLTVTLDNARGLLTGQFANPPLRARAIVTDHGQTMTGIVQSVRLGATISIDIET